jgi:Bacterial regulatory proteins, lacI family
VAANGVGADRFGDEETVKTAVEVAAAQMGALAAKMPAFGAEKPKPKAQSIPELLKSEMERYELTGAKVAELAGVNQSTVSRYLSGEPTGAASERAIVQAIFGAAKAPATTNPAN